MKRHFWKNRQWITIAIEEIVVGLVIMLHYQQLDARMPPALGLFDDAPFGLLYLSVGIVLLVNSLWDFYWYRIRFVLIALSGGLWTMPTVSYAMSDLITHNLTIIPFIFCIITINVYLSAWIEPRHKLKGGGAY